MIETHKERTYSLEAFKQALASAGFVQVEVTAEFGEQPVNDKSTRWFFHAKKG